MNCPGCADGTHAYVLLVLHDVRYCIYTLEQSNLYSRRGQPSMTRTRLIDLLAPVSLLINAHYTHAVLVIHQRAFGLVNLSASPCNFSDQNEEHTLYSQ